MAANIPQRGRRGTAPPVERPGALAIEPAPDPPAHLSADAARIWRDVAEAWELGADALPLLRAACEQWDTYQDARAVVARDGCVVAAGGLMRVHPAAKVAGDALTQFRQCFRQLGLEPPKGV
jgi:P27 family predicted phage terminase small subunit